MDARAIVLVLALGGLLAGCECAPPETAEDVVSRFYGAALLHDCDAVERDLGPTLRARFQEHGCDEALEGFADHPLQEIVGSMPDGRDPSAMLVRVRLSGVDDVTVVRVERIEGVWKVVSL